LENLVIEGVVSCRDCKLTMIRKHSRQFTDGKGPSIDDGLQLAIFAWNFRYEFNRSSQGFPFTDNKGGQGFVLSTIPSKDEAIAQTLAYMKKYEGLLSKILKAIEMDIYRQGLKSKYKKFAKGYGVTTTVILRTLYRELFQESID
jgi:hypothetical protein